MSDASEVKRAIYMSTGVNHRKNYDMIINLIERLLPNGEIKVTTPKLQELERITAERDAELKKALEKIALLEGLLLQKVDGDKLVVIPANVFSTLISYAQTGKDLENKKSVEQGVRNE